MARRRRSARTRPLGAMAALVLTVGLGAACGSRRANGKPEATLASSPPAAAAFEAIRESLVDADRATPAAVRALLDRFLAQFADDGLVPRARVALALVAMRQGDLATADAQLALTADVPHGSTRDLWTVAKARRLRLGGDPEGGLALLRPNVGKSVDPLVRSTFEEELTLAALETNREYEAISYMDAWLRASPPEEKDDTVVRVTAIVGKLPKDVLVGTLQAMHAARTSLGYGVDIQRILAERLVRIATTSGDAQLARMIIEAAPQAFAVAGDAGAALGELATSRRGLNVVEGRTIGLLLPTESPGLRDEAADVLRGVLWGLGLPRGSRAAEATEKGPARVAKAPAARAPATPACGTLETAPPPDEPKEEDAVRLVTRDDTGSVDRIEGSLDELAGEGAAMIIAGLDGDASIRALRWGEAHGVAVMALAVPEGGWRATPFGFVLGEPRANVLDVLVRAAPQLASTPITPVSDASELGDFPPQGGPVGPLMLAPPASCDVPSVRAGEPRFPIATWLQEKARAWLVSDSPGCASDLVGELADARASGLVALTLEAASILPGRASAGLRVVSARTGVVPVWVSGDPREDEIRRFNASLGPAGWWAALGRDAATLGRAAALELPTDVVSEPSAVADRRAVARDRLATARARLWTTEASTWSSDRTMKRTLCALDAARTPQP